MRALLKHFSKDIALARFGLKHYSIIILIALNDNCIAAESFKKCQEQGKLIAFIELWVLQWVLLYHKFRPL